MSLDFSSSQQFIRAAERLYPQLGYQKLSVRALAAQAQLSSGLFHHLFANKDDFMAQVFAQHFQRAFGWLAPEFAADAPLVFSGCLIVARRGAVDNADAD